MIPKSILESEKERSNTQRSHAVGTKDSKQEKKMHIPSTTWDVVILQQTFLRAVWQIKEENSAVI